MNVQDLRIETTGPWVLLVIGSIALVGAIYSTIWRDVARGLWMMWVFGFAIAGVGVYGPVFLEPYGKFVDPLLAMSESPSQETYQTVFDMVASGELPREYQEFALAFAVENPVDNMDQMLAEAAAGATDEASRNRLEVAQGQLAEKRLVEEIMQRPELTHDIFERIEPESRERIIAPLERLPAERLERFHLDPDRLRELAPNRPPG